MPVSRMVATQYEPDRKGPTAPGGSLRTSSWAQWIDNVYEISPNYSTDKGYQITFEDPMNDAFWSVTVYDKPGFMFNDLASLNSHSATPNPDGSFTISFGCGADAPNNIETANPTGAFNLAFRHYRPTEKVRNDGYRLLPFVKPVGSSR